MLILYIYLFMTGMVFLSSRELKLDVNLVSLLDKLGPALGAFKGINLAGFGFFCLLFGVFFKNHVIHHPCKGKLDTKF